MQDIECWMWVRDWLKFTTKDGVDVGWGVLNVGKGLWAAESLTPPRMSLNARKKFYVNSYQPLSPIITMVTTSTSTTQWMHYNVGIEKWLTRNSRMNHIFLRERNRMPPRPSHFLPPTLFPLSLLPHSHFWPPPPPAPPDVPGSIWSRSRPNRDSRKIRSHFCSGFGPSRLLIDWFSGARFRRLS